MCWAKTTRLTILGVLGVLSILVQDVQDGWHFADVPAKLAISRRRKTVFQLESHRHEKALQSEKLWILWYSADTQLDMLGLSLPR